jgi:hypothetical protein
MPRLHMTDIAVSALRTPGTYYDESTPAFGIRVGKSRKTWFVIRGHQRLRTNIGRYPATSLAKARRDRSNLSALTHTNRMQIEDYEAEVEARPQEDDFLCAACARELARPNLSIIRRCFQCGEECEPGSDTCRFH